MINTLPFHTKNGNTAKQSSRASCLAQARYAAFVKVVQLNNGPYY